MICFFSNICKWTLTLLTVESSWVVLSIYFMQSVGLFFLIQDGGKNRENRGVPAGVINYMHDYYSTFIRRRQSPAIYRRLLGPVSGHVLINRASKE